MNLNEYIYHIEYNADIFTEKEWVEVSKNPLFVKLNFEFVKKYKDDWNWYTVTRFNPITEEFIAEFQNKVDWVAISSYFTLDENFIRKYKDKIIWFQISCREYSIGFAREFQNRLNWHELSFYCDLSEDFMIEFKDKIDFEAYVEGQRRRKNFKILNLKQISL